MILGMPVTAITLAIGGGALFAVVLFQVLLGARVIKLGKRHRVVHKWAAYLILALASIHGLLGVLFVTGARIG
ncbi:MAG: hypothetical protein HGB10_06755 [Coriobacteriia bacterium]|nr:hypothetical protein [Coriobacteriia bacterium]